MYQDEIFFARNTKKHKNRKKERLSMRDYIKAAAVVLLVICVVLFIVDIFMPTYGFFAKVDSGYVGVITHFGKIKDGVLPAGFHVTGYFDQVHPINVRTQIRDGEVVAFSSDIQQVTLFVSINYNVTPEAANTLYKTISGDYFATLISPRVNENVKVVVSNYTAESLIASRETLSSEVLELMKRDLEPYGITATAISIENIDFTDAFESAVEAKQVATQEAQRARTQQEQQTMEAQQEAQRKKIAAEAAADVTRTEADAKAYEIKVQAEAEAEANQKLSDSITQSLIDYVQAQNWDGKLPGTYVGSDSAMPIIQAAPDAVESQEQ